MLKWYIKEAIEPVLLLSFFDASLGVAAAAFYGGANLFFGLLAIIGCVLAQMSVDVLDDYFDYMSGIDKETVKTKFSGGTDLVVKHKVDPKTLLILGLAIMAIAGVIGIYFVLKFPILIPLIVIGAFTILLYPNLIIKIPFLAEPATMLNFSLMAIGSFIVAHGSTTGLSSAIYPLVAVGMLGGIILLVNIVPDIKVDRKHGRRSGVVLLATPDAAAHYYLLWQMICYGVLLLGILMGAVPISFASIFLTLPIAYYVYVFMRNYTTPKEHEAAMGLNIFNATVISLLALASYLIYII